MLHKECEWKQGESARKNKNLSSKGKARETLWRLPLVGDDHCASVKKEKC